MQIEEAAMVFAISPPMGAEWIIIIGALVLLFGAKKLPELGSSVGKTITNFKKGVSEAQEEEADEDSPVDADGSVEAGSEERDSSGP